MGYAAKAWGPEAESEEPKLQTEISDDELVRLIDKYSIYYYKMFKYKWDLHAEYEDIYGILAIKACETKEKYPTVVFRKRCSIKTYIISAMRNRMLDYRKYLNMRQRKYPMLRLVDH
jgi:DNA-directed RNA polymerase specialized sigma24 family protein